MPLELPQEVLDLIEETVVQQDTFIPSLTEKETETWIHTGT